METATLTPLRPDRLGEDLVGLHLTENPHTTTLLTGLLTEPDHTGDDNGASPDSGVDGLAMRRCLIVLAAATRHDAAATTLLTLLERHPGLVTHTAAPVVQLVVDRAPDACGRELRLAPATMTFI